MFERDPRPPKPCVIGFPGETTACHVIAKLVVLDLTHEASHARRRKPWTLSETGYPIRRCLGRPRRDFVAPTPLPGRPGEDWADFIDMLTMNSEASGRRSGYLPRSRHETPRTARDT